MRTITADCWSCRGAGLWLVLLGVAVAGEQVAAQVGALQPLAPLYTYDDYGQYLARVPDLDGDDVAEIAVGAPGAGTVTVFSGATRSEWLTFSSIQFSGTPGATPLAGVPDIDGDGRGELAIGHYRGALPGTPASSGFVRVRLSASGTWQTIANPTPDSGDRFGVSVAGLTDINGDGAGDLVVGAPFDDGSGSLVNEGRAYVFCGATGDLLFTLAPPPIHPLASNVTQYFGFAVTAVPDASGDGIADVAVGAPRRETIYGGYLASFPEPEGGAVYLFSGAGGAPLGGWEDPDYEIGAQLGFAVTGVADTDGDGRGEIVAGAPFEEEIVGGDPAAVGRVYHLRYNGQQLVLLRELTRPAQSTWYNSHFGYSVSASADLDTDGVEDVVVGAPQAAYADGSAYGSATGEAWLFSGATGSRQRVLLSPRVNVETGAGFGTSVLGAGDLNGDGRGDVAVGAPDETNGPSPLAGQAFVWRSGVLYVDASQTNPQATGSSWADALREVHHGLDVAQIEWPSVYDTLWVAEGEYQPDRNCSQFGAECSLVVFKDGLSLYGGFLGNETELAQRPPGLYATLSGDYLGDDPSLADNFFQVLVIWGAAGVTVDGFEISGGNADGTTQFGTPVRRGGGLYVRNADPAIVDCRVRDNTAGEFGGGVYVETNADDGGVVPAAPQFVRTDLLRNRAGTDPFGTGAGGGAYFDAAQGQFVQCQVLENEATQRGGGIYADNQAEVVFAQSGLFDNQTDAGRGNALYVGAGATAELALSSLAGNGSGTPTTYASGLQVTGGTLLVSGPTEIISDVVALRRAAVLGPLPSYLLFSLPGDLLVVEAELRGESDVTALDAAIFGSPTVAVKTGATLQLAGPNAELNLSGNVLPPTCAPTGDAELWGDLRLEGSVLLTEGRVQNADITIENEQTITDCGSGIGGEVVFDPQSAAPRALVCSRVTTYSERYFTLDRQQVPQPLIENNSVIALINDPAPAGEPRGELFELRSLDTDNGLNGGLPGLYLLPTSTSYAAPFAIDRLELLPGTSVNLTDRLDQASLTDGLADALYVGELVLHPGAVLNTAFRRVYCQTILDESGNALLPGDIDGTTWQDIPITGYPLVRIDMEDPCEYDVRVNKYETPFDGSPGRGSITRESYPLPDDPDNFIMRLRTQAVDSDLPTERVRADGTFASSGGLPILVDFRYKFAGDDLGARLNVYLSDEPEVLYSLADLEIGECNGDVCKLATLLPPLPVNDQPRPGGIDSDAFARFRGVFDPGPLEFTEGTYVLVELVGGVGAGPLAAEGGAQALLDDWDPVEITCSITCHDVTGEAAVTETDYLLLLANLGKDVSNTSPCLDSTLAYDHYVDLEDLLGWETVLSVSPAPLNTCEPPLAGGGSGTGVDLGSVPVDGLLIVGKANTAGAQDDLLYAFREDATAHDFAPVAPASPGDPRGNGRLYHAPDGGHYQLHAREGLIDVATGSAALTPFSQTFSSGDDDVEVYVGPQATPDFFTYPYGHPQGLPLLDVAFDPNDTDVLYVVPVVVESTTIGEPTYRAAARLTKQPDDSYVVTQLYGADPCDDPCTNTVPCSFSECQLQDQSEIEVDADGNVYVLSASANSPLNDWLVVYDAASGTEHLREALERSPGEELRNPTALLKSRVNSDVIYLASGYDDDPSTATTYVYALTLTRGGGGAVTGVASLSELEVTQPTSPGALDPEDVTGYLAQVTGLVENGDGGLYVLGFTLPLLPGGLDATSPLYQSVFCDGCGLEALPTLAYIPSTLPAVSAADALTGATLAVPLGAVLRGRLGDVNCDGQVDTFDIDAFIVALSSEAAFAAAYPDCDRGLADCNGDGDVDTFDVDAFVTLLSQTW